MDDLFYINGVNFQKISEQDLCKINSKNLMFLFVSSSGVIADRGYIYLCSDVGTFYIKNAICFESFINKYFSFVYDDGWQQINLYFCDLLIINPKIYGSFVHELCNRNIRDFWFQGAIEIYRDKYCK